MHDAWILRAMFSPVKLLFRAARAGWRALPPRGRRALIAIWIAAAILYATFVVLFVPTVAAAEITSATILAGSWHSRPSACVAASGAPCRGANPGLLLETEKGWLVGGFRNSLGRPSAAAGRRWALAQGERAGLDFVALAATGYAAAPVVPVAGLAGRFRVASRVELFVLAIPPAGKLSDTAVVAAGARIGL